MTFGIIKQLHESTRDSVCVIDNKPIKKGDNVILLGDKVAKQRITVWEAAHIAPACANKVENWLANQPTTTAATSATGTTTTSQGYGDLSITEAFRLIANGNQRRDKELELTRELLSNQSKTIGQLVDEIKRLNSVVRLPESSPSNPPRPAADADNKPTNCLGVSKSTGNACKQTQNRLEANGYCGQHQSQSGDSERAVLDSHAEQVTEAQQQDIPAVPADLLEILG